MGKTAMKTYEEYTAARKLTLPAVKVLHRPHNTDQFIKDKEKATDLLLGLKLYLQSRPAN